MRYNRSSDCTMESDRRSRINKEIREKAIAELKDKAEGLGLCLIDTSVHDRLVSACEIALLLHYPEPADDMDIGAGSAKCRDMLIAALAKAKEK